MSIVPIIEFDRVSKIYPSGSGPITALHEVSLGIAAGEFIALIGPSGCGKTTLMRLIGDLEQPSAGTVRVKAKSPDQARRDRDYGIVFQSPVLYAWRTICKNVELPLELMGYPRQQRHERAMSLLRLVGLGDFSQAYPHQLSGGMQQRAAIARALSFAPSILLMDEPFGALDEITRERLQLELLSIWAESDPRPTVIFVTHSIPEAVFLADRVIVLSPRPGRVQRIIEVNVPRPRAFETREDPRFFTLLTEVRECLRAMEG
ncbi:MAG: ABC transporter ATP-binding protein [Chloroflexales bacterium]